MAAGRRGAERRPAGPRLGTGAHRGWRRGPACAEPRRMQSLGLLVRDVGLGALWEARQPVSRLGKRGSDFSA